VHGNIRAEPKAWSEGMNEALRRLQRSKWVTDPDGTQRLVDEDGITLLLEGPPAGVLDGIEWVKEKTDE
jgi:hypothetical protein